MNLELSTLELRLITQSLEHCLETCKHKKAPGKATCEDCDAARKLLERVRAADKRG
jgi:hypothetical protein